MNRFSLLLIIFGLAMMTYSLYEYVPQYLIGEHGEESVKKALAQEKKQNHPSSDQPLYPKRPKKDEKFGELVIPKLQAVLPIIEGTDPNQLERGIGHYDK